MICQGLEALRGLELEFVVRWDLIQDNHADKLVLVETQWLDRPQDAAFINSLELSQHNLILTYAILNAQTGQTGIDRHRQPGNLDRGLFKNTRTAEVCGSNRRIVLALRYLF